MATPKEKGPSKRLLQRKRSSVGPGTITRCLQKMIAKVECDTLQPQPGCEKFDPQWSTRLYGAPSKSSSKPTEGLCTSGTLLPSVTRTLCLWRDEEDEEYHLTVFRVDRDEVFLDLPLSGLLTGNITYDNSRPLWHEVTVRHEGGQRLQHLVFNLKASSSNASEAQDFNRKLSVVIETLFTSQSAYSHSKDWGEGGEDHGLQTSGESSSHGNKELTQSLSLITESTTQECMSTAAPVTMATAKPQGPLLGAEAPPMPVGDFSAHSRPGAPLSSSTAQQMTEMLAAAIQAGNVQKAQEIAANLAHSHTPVNVTFDSAALDRKAREQEIGVTVHVEDRESAGLTLNEVKVRPSDTILDLKRTFFGKYGFPLEVQKWIIGNRICGDEETLSKCEVSTTGHTLYLYLLNARAANIARDDHKRQWQLRNAGGGQAVGGSMRPVSSDYETMNLPAIGPPPVASAHTPSGQDYVTLPPQGQGVPQAGAARQQSQLSAHSSSSSLQAAASLGQEFRGNLDPASGPTSGQRGQGQGGTLVAVGGGGQTLGEEGQGMPETGEAMQFEEEQEESLPQGWQCESCTLINQPTRPGCELCGSQRPASYKVPSNYVVSDEERKRLERERQLEAIMQQQEFREREHNYQQLLQADSSDLVTNVATFACPICFDETPPGEGIVLRECLHSFCKTCLTEAVRLGEEAELKCPFQDDDYACNANLQEREVRALVPDQVYERYLRRSLDVAESQAANSYHCKTPDCRGWCIYEDLVNFFRCPVCRHENCLTCRAIHEGMNCKQYQEDLRIRAANDKAAQQTQVMLQDMVEKGEAMPCPKCQVIVQKKDGCDWIRCSICKTEICWVTKGPRWGPDGQGDLSGGCRCRMGGQRCHPNCSNCH